MATTDIHIRVDAEVKEETEKILKEIGITVSDLVNMTFRRTIMERGVPFEMRLAEVPRNMRIETKEDLVRLINESIDNDTGVRYSVDEVRAHLNEREREYKRASRNMAKVGEAVAA